MLLTEESFHGFGGEYSGNWTHALAKEIEFRIEGVTWETGDGYPHPDTVDRGKPLYFEGDGVGHSVADFGLRVYDSDMASRAEYTMNDPEYGRSP